MDDMITEEKSWQEIRDEARERLATTPGPEAPSKWAAKMVVALEGLLSHGWVRHSPWDRQELVARYSQGLTVELPEECDDGPVSAFWTAPALTGESASGTVRWRISAHRALITISADAPPRHPWEPPTKKPFAVLDLRRGAPPRLVWAGCHAWMSPSGGFWAGTQEEPPPGLLPPGQEELVRPTAWAVRILEELAPGVSAPAILRRPLEEWQREQAEKEARWRASLLDLDRGSRAVEIVTRPE